MPKVDEHRLTTLRTASGWRPLCTCGWDDGSHDTEMAAAFAWSAALDRDGHALPGQVGGELVDDAFEVGARPNPLAMDAFDKPRRFLLNRSADPSGVTGVGAVAWGCLWPSGRVSLDWQLEHQMRGGYYESIEDVLHLHGHATSVEWLDV